MSKLIGRIADFVRETDKILFVLVLFTSAFGSVIILSAGSGKQFIIQSTAIIIGIIVAIIISLIDYEVYMKYWYIIGAVAFILVILTFFIGYAPQTGGGGKAWIKLPGNISFQPSELLKIAFIVTFAKHISVIKGNVSSFVNVLMLALHGMIPISLIFYQNEAGSAIIIIGIFIGMMVAAGIKWRYFIATFLAGAIGVPLAFFLKFFHPYQIARIKSLYGVDKQLSTNGYQQWQGRIAFANGGVFGQGLFKGNEVQTARLPESYNDFIYASIGEELGLIGGILVLILLVAICIRILRIGALSKDRGGMIICVGVFSIIMSQSLINIGMCTSLLPVIGITLPFFSAGGSSVLCTFIGIGLVLSVYTHKNKRILYLSDE